MAKKAFKAESKRLLDMMINSIYTHKEIFLRELISNASDAMDKLYFKSMTENIGITRTDFEINLSLDKENRILTITDNGIGMTKDELENNLGVIAQSGSFKFKNENADKENEDISVIGQFGVGFYSAFMVASSVTVETKAYGGEQAYKWYSEGVDGYTITETEKDSYGTKITLKIKESTEEEDYEDFVTEYKIRGIVKKYSDYIRYPIKMLAGHSHLKEGTENEYETHYEIETLNSMVPIWNKSKTELTDEQYNLFYKEKYFDYEDPIAHIHTQAEGTATYKALLYIPAKAPFDYYSKDYEKGLQLYSNGVLIMDKYADLLPDHFSFVRGLVDSADLSLNISRELLQHDRQLKIIAKRIEKSIKNELSKMLKNDREKYEKFWKAFGLQLKFGVYNGFGAGKELLQDLLLFHSSADKKLVTLEEYALRMKEEQKYIFFASGDDVDKIDKLPQTELIKDKGYEILYLTDSIDEFVMQMMVDYNDKQFKSVSAGDLDLETPEEKEEMKAKKEESKGVLEFIRESLGGKVKDVRLSSILKSHAVCLTSDGILSVEMEKVLSHMPGESNAKAEKVLEINASHPIYEKLKALYETDKEKLKLYGDILYNQALLVEGLAIEDPVDFTNKICSLM
ncbi:MAG: molecular chaperone HtpG [Ruminiclostridium sp.]|nr:molecular chaperone HtpG [Ruminiclostridium sp.]